MQTFARKHKTPGRIFGKIPVPSYCHGCDSQRASVGHILRSARAQAKLTTGAPEDVYEQEADRVAEQVMRMQEPKMEAGSPPLSATPLAQQPAVGIGGGRNEAPSIVHEGLSSSGQLLDAATRAFFEPRFRHDFSQVRVHTDTMAAESAHTLSARAYTYGSDIAFNVGQYGTDSHQQKRLLAHELTHVVQQQRNGTLVLRRAPKSQSEMQIEKSGVWSGQQSNFTIEQLQKRVRSNYQGDRLGTVRLSGVPAEELNIVMGKIAAYFDVVGTRNSEVDAIVESPPGSGNKVFYTFRFGPNNDVDVERVGILGASTLLNPLQPDLARVYGFNEAAINPDQLKSWLRKRYPAIRVEGETVEEIRDSANQTLSAEARTPGWFRKNYKIHILNPMAAKLRLLASGRFSPKEHVGIKSFRADELRIIELALELLSPEMLKILEGVRMIRQTTHPEDVKQAQEVKAQNIGLAKWAQLDPSSIPLIAGETKNIHPNPTIFLFDSAFLDLVRGDYPFFTGGSLGVSSASTRKVLHEFGHVLQDEGFANSVFVNLAAGRDFTQYAEGDWRNLEQFPEAFAIYATDPEWVENNYPDIFAWFEELSRSGNAP